jgi:CHASE3 domain sensor protein
MDRLERFVRENREQLDRYEPSPGVWEKIEGKRIFISKKLLTGLSAAALLALVLGTAMFLYSSANRNTNSSGLTSQIKEIELFYNSAASTLYRQARPMLTRQPEIEKELDNDLRQIDKMCSEIKNDLNDNVDSKEVIEALIQNYTTKIHILEDMLRMLNENENNTEKQKSNEL